MNVKKELVIDQTQVGQLIGQPGTQTALTQE
jgi:hypothetical protein